MDKKNNSNSGGSYVAPETFHFSLNVEGILCASVGTKHEGFTLQDAPENGFEWK